MSPNLTRNDHESTEKARPAKRGIEPMKIRERRVKMLTTVTCGELTFRVGQSVLVPVKLADLWIQRGLAEKVTSFDDLRADIRGQRRS